MGAASVAAVVVTLGLCSGSGSGAPARPDRLEVRVRLQSSGVLEIEERYRFSPAGRARLLARPGVWPFSRSIFFDAWPGRWPLRQRAAAISVTDASGPVAFQRIEYGGDRVMVRLGRDTFEGVRGTLRLRYEVLGVARVRDGRTTAHHEVRLYDVPVAFPAARVALLPPDGDATGARLSLKSWDAEYANQVFATPEVTKRALVATNRHPLPENGVIAMDLDVPAAWTPASPPTRAGAEHWHQAKPAWILAALLLLMLPVVWWLPAGWAVGATRVAHVATLGALCWLIWPLARFDILSPQYTGVERAVSAASAVVVYLGLLGAVVALMVAQERLLRAARREAWFMEALVPVAMVLFVPAAEVAPGLWVLPLAAAVPLVWWSRTRLQTWLGVQSHRIAEAVAVRGEVGAAELARELGLSRRRLLRIVAQQPELPIVVDHEHQRLLSPATAALRADLRLCPSCGGATVVAGQERLECSHCRRPFHGATVAAAPQRPIPPLVGALAQAARGAGIVVGIWTAVLLVVGFLDEVLHASLGSAAGYVAGIGAIGGGVALLLYRFGVGLGEGRRFGALRVLLLLGAPLILPLLALRALRSRRVALQFGELEPAALDRELESRGELDLRALGAFLGCPPGEAAEVAVFLAGNGRIDAVYDRVGARLVARSRYRQLARAGACPQCGGILGVRGGDIACHFCGHEAAAA